MAKSIKAKRVSFKIEYVYAEVSEVHMRNPDGVQRTFVVRGGYIYERVPRRADGNDVVQVCDGLVHRGNTLTCSDRAKLPEIIREEWRRMVREYRNMNLDPYDWN